MRVAVVSEYPRGDPVAFAGIAHSMRTALEARHELAGYFHAPIVDLEKALTDLPEGMRRLRELGEEVSRRLRGSDADVVVCQGSSMLPFLDTDKFVVLWHDSTWHTLLQVPDEEFKSAHRLLFEWDRMALDACDLVVFAADWVRGETARQYPTAAEKLAVVPFGPSIDAPPPDEVARSIMARPAAPCRLAFVGVDWMRKGLPAAFSVLDALRRQGVPAVLDVVGTDLGTARAEAGGGDWSAGLPFDGVGLERLRLRCDPDVRVRGYLRKDSPQQSRAFREILCASHFLLHPAHFECFGVGLVEAGHCGVPVLSGDCFGPRSIVVDGANGHRFPLPEYVEAATDLIRGRLADPARYRDAALSARRHAEAHLSWPGAVARLTELIDLRA